MALQKIKSTVELKSSQIPFSEGGGALGGSAVFIECPRDAMQGWPHFIPTHKKIDYLNSLLQCGFDTLDFGSFVSPKAIPQMADTKAVITSLNLENTSTKLLAIIANERGANDAAAFDEITYLGFPFSISETFQQRNTNSSVAESLKRVEAIQNICVQHNKQMVVYISMGFGNPYGDLYNHDIVLHYSKKIEALGVKIISIADTVGLATPDEISVLMKNLIPECRNIEVGIHLHSTPEQRINKLQAALQTGCKRFDAALKGIGGCPMAGNDLVGNIDTEVMLHYFESQGFKLGIDKEALRECSRMAEEVFV